MNQSEIQALPKVHLHHHLDCSLRLETVWELAEQFGISLKSKNIKELFNEYKINTRHTSLDEVLDRFFLCPKVMGDYQAIQRVVFENVEDAYQQGIKLLELRFSPSFINFYKKFETDLIVEAVLDGIAQGMKTYEIEVGLICTLTRELDFEENEQAVHSVIKFKKSNHSMADRLVGIDLAGRESAAPPIKFKKLLQVARGSGFKLSIHSGEDSSAEHLFDTIKTLQPERIGHGIRAIDDQEVIRTLVEKNILLEVCPTSNWITAAADSLESHPIRALFDAGVKICLNTDDPQIFDLDLNQEYENAIDLWSFSIEELKKMNQWAFEGSFLADDLKSKTRKYFF